MSLSGIIFDVYDDLFGDTLTKVASHLPENLKNHTVHTIEELEKLSDDDYAGVFVTENMNKVRKYPIDNAGETVFSTIYFDRHRDKLTKEAQSIIASRLDSACRKFGLDVPDSIEKLAELNLSDEEWVDLNKHGIQRPTKVYIKEIEKTASSGIDDTRFGDDLVFEAQMQKRKQFLKEAQIKDLDELLGKKDDMSPREFCDRLTEMDKEAGVFQYWGTRILHPELSVFYPRQEEEPFIKVGSEKVSEERVKSIPRENLEKYLNSSSIEEFEKDPVTIFQSFPTPLQSMILGE